LLPLRQNQCDVWHHQWITLNSKSNLSEFTVHTVMATQNSNVDSVSTALWNFTMQCLLKYKLARICDLSCDFGIHPADSVPQTEKTSSICWCTRVGHAIRFSAKSVSSLWALLNPELQCIVIVNSLRQTMTVF